MVEHIMMFVIENVTADTGLVVPHSEEDVPLVLGRVFIYRVAVLESHLCAAVIFIELEVHHAGNRIRSVGGRSAIFQNLDTLDGGNGNRSEVNKTVPGEGGSRERRNAAAVN